MTDIVERLRSPEVLITNGLLISPVAHEGAAEIARLRAENERFRALLEEAASDLTDWTIFWKISDALGWERPHG